MRATPIVHQVTRPYQHLHLICFSHPDIGLVIFAYLARLFRFGYPLIIITLFFHAPLVPMAQIFNSATATLLMPTAFEERKSAARHHVYQQTPIAHSSRNRVSEMQAE